MSRFVLGMLLLGVSRAQAEYRSDRIIILPKADRAAAASELHKEKGRKVRKKLSNLRGIEVVQLSRNEDPLAAIEEYNKSGAVEFAEPDFIFHAAIAPNDPQYASQWHLTNAAIGAIRAWDVRHDASGITVAILDTGARITHEDLAPNLWRNPSEIPGNDIDDDNNGYVDDIHGINSITGSGSPVDDSGHGTHVAGILGARGDNGKGVTGVAWNVQLMPLKFIDANGNGSTSDFLECLSYALKNGAKVINASFGAPDFSLSVQTALANARLAGVVVVAAAGNEQVNNDLVPSYPANYELDNIVSVCATTIDDLFDTTYSNFGLNTVDLAAPGTDIFSTTFESDTSYGRLSGTSMAAPIVAGAAALLRAQFPNESAAQIITRLMATTDKLPTLVARCASGGRINLAKAFAPFVSANFTTSQTTGAPPLNVQFTNSSFGEITSQHWDFGDGGSSTDPNPSHVFRAEGWHVVTLTVSGPDGIQSIKTQTIQVLPAYAVHPVDFEWIDPSEFTQLFLADNGVSGAQDLTFEFDFYGQTHRQIYVGANGLLGFDAAGFTANSNADIPSSASPNGALFPYWDNLNPAAGGSVRVGVMGSAPRRRFVASWVGVPRNIGGISMTFQAVLFETTGEIQFNYKEVNPADPRGGGARATIGIEDSAGVTAAKFAYNAAPTVIANNQSLRFSRRGRLTTPALVEGMVRFDAGGEEIIVEASTNLRDWQEVHRGPSFSVAPDQTARFFRAVLAR